MTRGRDDRTRWMAKVLLALIVAYCPLISASAQEEPEYRLEIGAGAGTVTYLGDFNGNLTKEMQPWGAVMAKYRMNPRMSVGLTVGFGKLKGSIKNADTWYPNTYEDFSNSVVDAGLRYEYTVWAFGTGREYRGARKFTPFITLGVGATHHSGKESGLAANFPLGAGVKYKLGERLNLTAEWRMHFSTGDLLDDVKDPHGIPSTGFFKNTDCYSVIQVALSYDIWAKCKTCNNDRY